MKTMQEHHVSASVKALWIAAFVFLFLFQLSLNALSPLVADDYSYVDSYLTGERIASVGDILRSMQVHYQAHGGRIVAHFFAQLFLWLGKPLFNVLNALVYLAYACLVYKHILGAKEHKLWLFILVNVVLWFFIPVFGHTVLFLTGAFNYLWATAVVLAFLLPYRLFDEKPPFRASVPAAVLMLPAGFLAGFQSETASGAALLFVLLLSARALKTKRALPLWWITGAVGCAAGLIVMVAAPGNFQRLSGSGLNGASEVFKRIFSLFLVYSGKYLLRAFILSLGLSFMLLFGRLNGISRESISLFLIYILVSLAANYVMLLSLTYPTRAQFTYVTFLVIAFGAFYVSLDYTANVRYAIPALTAPVVLAFLAHAAFTVNDIGAVYVAVQAREESIAVQKAAGVTDVAVPAIDPRTPYCALDIGNFTGSADFWTNRLAARYYGVSSIRTEEEPPLP